MGLCLGVACKRSLCSEHPGNTHADVGIKDDAGRENSQEPVRRERSLLRLRPRPIREKIG
jgi:hypothetical protein